MGFWDWTAVVTLAWLGLCVASVFFWAGMHS